MPRSALGQRLSPHGRMATTTTAAPCRSECVGAGGRAARCRVLQAWGRQPAVACAHACMRAIRYLWPCTHTVRGQRKARPPPARPSSSLPVRAGCTTVEVSRHRYPCTPRPMSWPAGTARPGLPPARRRPPMPAVLQAAAASGRHSRLGQEDSPRAAARSWLRRHAMRRCRHRCSAVLAAWPAAAVAADGRSSWPGQQRMHAKEDEHHAAEDLHAVKKEVGPEVHTNLCVREASRGGRATWPGARTCRQRTRDRHELWLWAGVGWRRSRRSRLPGTWSRGPSPCAHTPCTTPPFAHNGPRLLCLHAFRRHTQHEHTHTHIHTPRTHTRAHAHAHAHTRTHAR